MSFQEHEVSQISDPKIHFTYKLPDKQSLCQGDLLIPTENLVKELRIRHPHFADQEYRYFMILTQSCDLVRRDGKGWNRIIFFYIRKMRCPLQHRW